MLGAEVTVAFAQDFLAGRVRLEAFDLWHLAGGFSFGDDLGSGKVFANRLRSDRFADGTSVWSEVLGFLDGGGAIVGVCNGFQVLVRAGLLPNVRGRFEQEVALAPNERGTFEDRWVSCRARGALDPLVYPPGLETTAPGEPGRVIALPVRHGEGRLVCPDPALREAVAPLVVLEYVQTTRDGSLQLAADYPANPNGATWSAAGLMSRDGHVLGLMPHPEAYLFPENHPDWPTQRREGVLPREGAGLALLRAFLRMPRRATLQPIHPSPEHA
jgi:phosphoribosylformylglycinamidine synthase